MSKNKNDAFTSSQLAQAQAAARYMMSALERAMYELSGMPEKPRKWIEANMAALCAAFEERLMLLQFNHEALGRFLIEKCVINADEWAKYATAETAKLKASLDRLVAERKAQAEQPDATVPADGGLIPANAPNGKAQFSETAPATKSAIILTD
jgi:hypothetical protein